MVAAAAAVLLGNGQAEEADFAQFRHDRGIDGFGPVPRRRMRRDLAIDEFGGEALGGGLFVGEFQVHRDSGARKLTAEVSRMLTIDKLAMQV